MRTASFRSFSIGFAIALCCVYPAFSQGTPDTTPSKQLPAAEPAQQEHKPDTIRILYTGKSMGYFRMPDWQGPLENGGGCKDPARQKDKSEGAAEFEQVLRKKSVSDGAGSSILLGTGDNFAPEIEARDFCEPPPGQPDQGKDYGRVGKELFDWDVKSKTWIRSDSHSESNATPANGLFMIPIDNVANFFVKQGYAALVPGKQDFYFGPERVRELARFMATQPIPSTSTMLHTDGQGVQMLGANIIIETEWKSAHSLLPDSENPPWFIPRFPTAADLAGAVGGPDLLLRMTGITDGGEVYPWFRGVTLELSGENADSKLLPLLNSTTFYLCGVDGNSPGNPNAIPKPVKEGPCKVLEKKAGERPNQFLLDFPWLDPQHFYTLRVGGNYGLCAVASDATVKSAEGSHTFCARFNVYTPFLQSSADISGKRCSDLEKLECYHDPDPYVLLETKDQSGIPVDVAIFGVVDPQIGANVGMMNFAWSNTASRQYKTVVSVQDPGEALKQLLDSFDRRLDENGYKKETSEGTRRLVKVLLAQMTSQEAEVLGIRTKQFQVVVSAADPEMATVGDTVTTEWNAPLGTSVRHPMVLNIPEPYIVSGRNPSAIVDVGKLDIQFGDGPKSRWTLASKHEQIERQPDSKAPKTTSDAFWKAVEAALKRDCLQKGFDSHNQSEQIEFLTICEMQNHTGADVALLQKRDFFADLPSDAGDIPSPLGQEPENVLQQLLDRIVWKGDFLQLLYVPGSALQQAMKQSKAFDAADRSNLSVGQHKNRGLISIGITYDPTHNEYLIDGFRLDPKKLYSVATSDFIGGGDTGYPDLAAAQVRPPHVPTDYDKQLITISGVVCQGLAGEHSAAYCIGPIERDSYLDEIALAPSNTGPSSTPSRQLWMWSFFHHPRAVPGDPRAAKERPATLQNLMDQTIQYRKLWDFELVKATFGVTTLSHNGTDAQIDAKFGGITTPGVNSHHFTNWSSDFQAQLTRNWKHYQWFASPSYTYNVQFKGQPNASRQVNQITNLGMFDLGFARLWSERGPAHHDLVFTTHFETPLLETFTAFTLKSSPPGLLQFNQPRSYTMLFRGGFRLQRRVSSIEFGPEGGHQWGAVNGFQFLTNGTVKATCLALSDISFSTCVSNDSDPKKTNPPTITPLSAVRVIQGGRDHSGMYWKINLTVPLYSRVSYVFTDTGDWFFVHYASENTTDTLFRDISQHQLRFTIFPSFSIGPELDLLLYQNKTSGPLKGSFLRQDQFMMRAQFSFDLFNWRKRMDQIEYAPPKPQ